MERIITQKVRQLYSFYNLTNTDLKMTLTIFFIVVSSLGIQASTHSENTTLTLNIESASKLSIEMNHKTSEGLLFLAKMDRNTTGNYGSTPPPKYKTSQETVVKGVITDEDDNPLPGANIIVKGTTIGVTSDFDGKYSISIPQNVTTLVFSYIGYQTQEVAVNGREIINIQLISSMDKLDEIVVVGYGVQKRVNLTGSIASIKSDDIVKNSTSNISSALSGRLAGLVAIQSSGEPGSDRASLRIRGMGTTNSTSPLVLVDGIPRSLESINSNDIESISILKDAAAAAIYGMRASNGVILVTTKRGGGTEPQFSFDSYMGIQKNTRMPDFLNSYDYAVLLNEANSNDGVDPAYTAEELQKFKDGSDSDAYPDTNWVGETLGTGSLESYNLSVRGSYDKVKYFTSLGHLNQGGIYKSVGYKKYSFRSNIDTEVSNSINFQADFSGFYEDYKRPSASVVNIFSNLMRRPPTLVNRYSNGGYSGESSYQAINESGYNNRQNFTFQSKLAMNIIVPFVEGLSLTTQVAYDRFAGRNKNFSTPSNFTTYDKTTGEFTLSTPVSRSAKASLSEGSQHSSNLTFEQIIDYKKSIGLHQLGAKFVYSRSESRTDFLSARRRNFIGTSIDFFTAGDKETRDNNNGARNTGILGYASRVNYSYDGKYFIEFNGRYDGSFLFHKDARYGFFPAVSGAWRISQEDFMKDYKNIDNLKVRVSYGKLGSDRGLSDFRYLSLYYFREAFIDGGTPVNTVSDSGISDTKTTWEKAEIYNLGVEMSLWDGLLSIDADVFYKHTTDILSTSALAVPQTFGASLPTQNIGVVDNKGFEIILGHNNSVNELNYSANLNFGFARNKVIDIAEAENVDDLIRRTGRSIGAGSRIGHQAEGLFLTQAEIDALNANAVAQTGDSDAVYQTQNPKPGDIKYSDLNGDGIVNSKDRTIIGYGIIPEINFGLNIGLNYKQFDFSMLFQGAANFDMYLSEESAWAFFNGGKVFGDHLGRAKIGTDGNVINSDATYPRLSTGDIANRRRSTYWIRSGDYTRLKNIEIGYTLDKRILDKLKLNHLRLYLNGRNLFTWSDIKHLDPENPHNRGWFYPQQRVFNIGINVKL